ncbi:Protein SPA chloroplastic, partial [Bienertia sinuspersici]
ASSSFHTLQTPFLSSSLTLSAFNSSSSFFVPIKLPRNQRTPTTYPCIRAADLDQNTVIAISVGFVSVAIGIGIPVFYETQIDNAVSLDCYHGI